MVEEIATVIKTSEQGVWLQTKVTSSCQTCSANDSCTSGVVAKAMTRRDYQFFLPVTSGLQAGQQVRIGISDGVVMKSAVLVYLVPLLGFILGAGAGVLWQFNEAWQLLMGILFGMGGMFIVRLSADRMGSAEQHITILSIESQLHVTNLASTPE